MQAMRRLVRVLVALAVVAAAAAQQAPTAAPATPTPATPAAPATPTPATPTAPAPAAGSSNITGVLAKGGQFTTFMRLLKSTGVASQINTQASNGNGLTVFAPTDNAFTSLPSGTLNSLSDQDKNALVQYHVVSAAIPQSQFDTVSNPLRTQAGSSSPGEYPLNVTSVGGQQVNISTGVVNATVDNTLYAGDNLVVYQVNKVLLPAKLFGTAEAPAPAPLAPAKKKGKTPASVADSPEAAEESPDATTSIAAARVTGGRLAAALALAAVWWGL